MTQRDPLKTLIIAEAGVNHNGDISLARQLIDVAADVGADFVKFQTFTADKLVTKSAEKAEYQNQTTDVNESQHTMIRKLELNRATHHLLLRNNVVLLEGLDLSGVSPGDYELIALPLKLKGADGSPTRVVLKESND
jgi:sialic acid synthase SpsE